MHVHQPNTITTKSPYILLWGAVITYSMAIKPPVFKDLFNHKAEPVQRFSQNGSFINCC